MPHVQLITLKILRFHFTAHSWLICAYALHEISSVVDMVLEPWEHLKGIPDRCCALLACWVARYIGWKIFNQRFLRFLFKIGCFCGLLAIPVRILSIVRKVRARALRTDWANEAQVLARVQSRGDDLRHATRSLRANKKIVLAAVVNNGDAMSHAGPGLRADREYVLAATAISEKGVVVCHAMWQLKVDREFMLAAIALRGYALKYANPILRADMDFHMAAVARNGLALQHANLLVPHDGPPGPRADRR